MRVQLMERLSYQLIERSKYTWSLAMSRVILALLVVIGVLFSTTTAQEQQCPENQEWTNCGSACPPSCNSSPNQPCTLQCVIGCQCKQGFLLNGGECVLPHLCKN